MSIIARMQVMGTPGSICIERFEDYAQMGRFTLRDQGQSKIDRVHVHFDLLI